MKPSKFYEALHTLICERVPMHIWGACSVGKAVTARSNQCQANDSTIKGDRAAVVSDQTATRMATRQSVSKCAGL